MPRSVNTRSRRCEINRLRRHPLLACWVAAAVLSAAAGAGCRARGAAAGTRVIVLGFDGMDYGLTKDLMARGRLPHLARLAQAGGLRPLVTTIPPQSPVAWSSFITGLDPGGHGIYDFVHRDPQTKVPYLSTTKTENAGRTLKIGGWQFPLSGGEITLLRHGTPFWEVLEDHGIPTTVIRMPANFPPSGTAGHELSGMGTPDIIGTYGTFSFYTSVPFAFAGRTLSGGRAYPVDVIDHVVQGTLYGPDNPFRREQEKVTADFTVYIDAVRPIAKIVAGDEERVLKVGEWSDWVPVTFGLIPTQSLSGMCRFYLRQVRPDFELYVSPVNLDPMNPALPISTPASFAAEIAKATGRFYTQGMPEDTKSLNEEVLTRDEFLTQARWAGQEVLRQYRYILDGFQSGLLFYYVGNLDQVSHMMWRPMDPGHPAYDPVADPPYRTVVEDIYVDLDKMVGETLDRMGAGTTLIVMSDHGFASWRRAFNLNSWLRDNGYLTLIDPERKDDPGFFSNVDWSQTRAYGLGLNGLYLNLEGREKSGIVEPDERDQLLDEIAGKLLATVDPKTGERAVTKMYRSDRTYAHKEHLGIAPDLLVGYAKGTRCSNESALGGIPAEVIVDNKENWSGDHCMDHETVPGVLLVNRPLRTRVTSLQQLAGEILGEFGIQGFPAPRADD